MSKHLRLKPNVSSSNPMHISSQWMDANIIHFISYFADRMSSLEVICFCQLLPSQVSPWITASYYVCLLNLFLTGLCICFRDQGILGEANTCLCICMTYPTIFENWWNLQLVDFEYSSSHKTPFFHYFFSLYHSSFLKIIDL